MLLHLLTFSHPKARVSSIEMLKESALKQGHDLKVIHARDCQLEFIKKSRILVEGKRPKDINILIVKAGFSGTELDSHVGVIKQFDLSNIPLINNHLSVMRTKNKIRSLQILKKYNIPTPKAYVVRSSKYIDEMVKNINYYPIILKSVSGSKGAGVSIIETQRGLRSIIEMLIRDENVSPLIVQEYVKESSGKDIRIFIVGNKIIAAMERIARRRGEFRSNFSLGGRVKVAELSDKEKKLSIAATNAFGLEIAGVDLIRTKDGPKILEVNCNPGLEGITRATDKDIAGEIIKYAVKAAKNPNILKKNRKQEKD